jgi:hypothetical protein
VRCYVPESSECDMDQFGTLVNKLINGSVT